jgi:hypothetical protein
MGGAYAVRGCDIALALVSETMKSKNARTRYAACYTGGDVRRRADACAASAAGRAGFLGGGARGVPPPRPRGVFRFRSWREKNMHIVTNVGPLAALIAGILILAVPRLLNYIVALYLIIIGLLGLFGDHIH